MTDDFDYAGVPARIMFWPAKGYIEITDKDELDALIEALVIKLHWGSWGNKRREYTLFTPEFHTREYVEGFLLGRRHALLQNLGSSVSSQTYNERRAAILKQDAAAASGHTLWSNTCAKCTQLYGGGEAVRALFHG